MSISVENISFCYAKQRVLSDVSFDVGNGSLMVVLGPNGVGKTTLFRCILGLERSYEGQIRIDGNDAKSLSAKALAGRVAFIPQNRQPAFGFSVMDMVLMGTAHRLSGVGIPGKSEEKAARQALERVGIASLAEKDYGRISGGEQQLVLIARALVQDSGNLLMDEPTSALDYGNQARVMEAIRSLADSGYCVILSTHNPQYAVWYADFALALSDGKVAAFDVAEKIITKPLIEKLYGIEVSVLETPAGRLITPSVVRRDGASL